MKQTLAGTGQERVCEVERTKGGGMGSVPKVYLIKGLRNHGDLVALVGRLSEALEGGGLNHSLTEGDNRVCNLHFNLSIELSQVLQCIKLC